MPEVKCVSQQTVPKTQSSGSNVLKGAAIGAVTGAAIGGVRALSPLTEDKFIQQCGKEFDKLAKGQPQTAIDIMKKDFIKKAKEDFPKALEKFTKNKPKRIALAIATGALALGTLGAIVGAVVSNKKTDGTVEK